MKQIKWICALALLLAACKKPTDNLKIVVDTDIIKYTAVIQVADAANLGVVPKNAVLTITGSVADDIYEISGKKNFKISNGFITIGPSPSAIPTMLKPDSCMVQIKAPGYVTVEYPLIFTADKKQQRLSILMEKAGAGVAPTSPPVVPPVNDSVRLNFTGTCSSNNNVVIRPSMYVFYREKASGSIYQYLGYLDKGTMVVTALVKGKTYDFQVTYGGQNYSISQLIELPEYDLTINMGNACSNF